MWQCVHARYQDLGLYQCNVGDYHALTPGTTYILVRGNHRHRTGADLNPDGMHANRRH